MESPGQGRRLHELPANGFGSYPISGYVISAVFDNWDSEFRQVAALSPC